MKYGTKTRMLLEGSIMHKHICLKMRHEIHYKKT